MMDLKQIIKNELKNGNLSKECAQVILEAEKRHNDTICEQINSLRSWVSFLKKEQNINENIIELQKRIIANYEKILNKRKGR